MGQIGGKLPPMRFPEDKIKAAILHPEAEIQEVAASYFAMAYSPDDSIMPLVIQAVEKYGRENAFSILRTADRLVQTPATLQWCMAELRRDYDLKDIGQDNYHFAVALILCEAAPRLLVPVREQILALPAFPAQLQERLFFQTDTASWDWATGWRALEAWGDRTMDNRTIGRNDLWPLASILGALGRCREQGMEAVLNLLQRRYRGFDKRLMEWLEPTLVELAGRMKLEAAIPLLLDRLFEDDDAVGDEVGPALVRIGTEKAVQALAEQWSEGDESYRFTAMEVFEHIHCDLSVAMADKFLPDEESEEVACGLGFALLSNFAEDAIGPVRELVLREGPDELGERRDLRWRLIAAATIMNQPFLEYPAWYQEAVKEKWGRGHYKPDRIADNFGPDKELEDDEWDEEDTLADFEEAEGFQDELPQPYVHHEKKFGRNDPCPCGSGKKYKKCCLHKKPFDPMNN